MTPSRRAQVLHGLTALVAAFALVVQLILVLSGAATLVETDRPPLGLRLFRMFSYFTILSNLLVLGTTWTLARDPHRDGRVWRVLRLDAVVAITVTGVIHWFLLRPLLDLDGWSYATDKLLHVAVPLLAVAGWAVCGPRPRITPRVVLQSLIFPVAWLVFTLVVGAASGWYPYPFLDVPANGPGAVAVACVGVALVVFALSALVWWLDRVLGAAPRTAEGRPG